MIEVQAVTKEFEGFKALSALNCSIESGCIYGLVGSNGAGKSTLLRLLSGVYKPNSGQIIVDGEAVYNNPGTKKRIVYVADELYFLPQSSLFRMAMFYAASYESFSFDKYKHYVSLFGLDDRSPLSTYSKGMRRQASIILALSCQTDFLFLDETFDGLDPVMRNLVKRILYTEVEQRQMTTVIASHSLRELEDTCDQLSLLHKGGIVFESDIQNLKTSLFKVQLAFADEFDQSIFEGLEVVNFEKQGSVALAIIKGDRCRVQEILMPKNPLLMEILPLSLEEVFVYEMEALGYTFGAEVL